MECGVAAGVRMVRDVTAVPCLPRRYISSSRGPPSLPNTSSLPITQHTPHFTTFTTNERIIITQWYVAPRLLESVHG